MNNIKSFSFKTIENFDQHIRASIPDYDGLYNSLLKISDYFINPKTNVYDLGTSTGQLILDLNQRVKQNHIDNVEFIGIENEHNFFKYHNKDLKNIKWVHQDLMAYDEWKNISFITSIFTLQFIKPCQRFKILKDVYQASNPGSAFVFSEKTYSNHSHVQDINTFLHYDWKSENFTVEEISHKEKSLRSMMRLRTKQTIEQEIFEAGWKIYDTFWQQHNFVAWIAIKDN